jgi:uncharacterized protein YoxC
MSDCIYCEDNKRQAIKVLEARNRAEKYAEKLEFDIVQLRKDRDGRKQEAQQLKWKNVQLMKDVYKLLELIKTLGHTSDDCPEFVTCSNCKAHQEAQKIMEEGG